LPFSTKDTVDAAAYVADVHLGCVNDTIQFSYPNINQVNSWTWAFGNADTTHDQDPSRLYTVFDTKPVYLFVSNGFCTDTATGVVVLDNAIDAAFEAPNILCPEDLAVMKNNSKGKLSYWDWSFGDGKSEGTETPPDHLYPKTGIETNGAAGRRQRPLL
jgi:PKD repeat protein